MSVAQFAEALGVRYVVDGSLRRAGGDLRVNARLTDTTNGRLIWAERYDGPRRDRFRYPVQTCHGNRLYPRSAGTQSQMEAIATPDTRELEAREAFQRGWALYGRFNEADNAASIPHFERANRT